MAERKPVRKPAAKPRPKGPEILKTFIHHGKTYNPGDPVPQLLESQVARLKRLGCLR